MTAPCAKSEGGAGVRRAPWGCGRRSGQGRASPLPAPTRERLTVATSLYRTVTASAEGNVSCPRAGWGGGLTAWPGPRAARACPLRPALHPAVGARRQGLGAHGQVEVPTLRILPTPGTGARHRGWLR